MHTHVVTEFLRYNSIWQKTNHELAEQRYNEPEAKVNIVGIGKYIILPGN